MIMDTQAPIEETVDLDQNYPRASERYFTEFFFIPSEKSKFKGTTDELKDSSCTDKNGIKTSLNCEEAKVKDSPSTSSNALKDSLNGEQLDDVKENSSISEEVMDVSPSGEQEKEIKNGEIGGCFEDNYEHTCVLIHTNKLCLITLSHLHPILSEKKEITKINYDVGKFNRLENNVSGKGKRGAQMIGPRSPICIITCSDGSTCTVLAGVNGKLVEVNEHLQSNPQLLSRSPKEDGYLAVILPPLHNGKVLLNRLYSRDEYEKRILQLHPKN